MATQVLFLRIAAVLGGLGVAIGAFGAHGLKQRLSDPELLAIFETGVRYHFYHALALLAMATMPGLWVSRWAPAAGWAFTVGVVVFSGSLYALALTNIRVLGAITPIGGVAFIVGWFCLIMAAGALAR